MAYRITSECNGCTACVRLCPTGAITGERKALHVINPFLCIECGACGRICPQEAVQDAFGISCRRISKLSLWPKPVIDGKTCVSCRICIEGCPASCLSGRTDGEGKHEIAFLADPKSCISCGFCEADCPVEAIRLVVPEQPAVEVKQG
ncbi:MAG: 4Fe-4S binding protein [Syntrophales bacterium]